VELLVEAGARFSDEEGAKHQPVSYASLNEEGQRKAYCG